MGTDSLRPEVDEEVYQPYPPISARDHVALYEPAEVCS